MNAVLLRSAVITLGLCLCLQVAQAASRFNPVRFGVPGITYLVLSDTQQLTLGELQTKYNRDEAKLRKQLFPSIDWARATAEEKTKYRENVSLASEKFATQSSLLRQSIREEIHAVLTPGQQNALVAIDEILAEGKRSRIAAREVFATTLHRPYEELVNALSGLAAKDTSANKDSNKIASRLLRYLEKEIMNTQAVHQILLDWVVSTQEQRNQINHIRSQYAQRSHSTRLPFKYASVVSGSMGVVKETDPATGAVKQLGKAEDANDTKGGVASQRKETLVKRYQHTIHTTESVALQTYFNQERIQSELALLTPEQRKVFDTLFSQCQLLNEAVVAAKRDYSQAQIELLTIQQGKIARVINAGNSSSVEKEEVKND